MAIQMLLIGVIGGCSYYCTLNYVTSKNRRRRLHQFRYTIMNARDRLNIVHVFDLLDRLMRLPQFLHMVVLRALFEFHGNVLETVVDLNFGLKHNGFQILGGFIGPIILK